MDHKSLMVADVLLIITEIASLMACLRDGVLTQHCEQALKTACFSRPGCSAAQRLSLTQSIKVDTLLSQAGCTTAPTPITPQFGLAETFAGPPPLDFSRRPSDSD